MTIEFLNKNVVEDILIRSGWHQGMTTMATRLLNEHISTILPDIIEGMSVSVDVSTNDHDSGNRLFGVVNEVMEDPYDKNGYTLLVYETQPNFDIYAPKVSKGDHDKAFEQWCNSVDSHLYSPPIDEDSAKIGYDLAIAINNI